MACGGLTSVGSDAARPHFKLVWTGAPSTVQGGDIGGHRHGGIQGGVMGTHGRERECGHSWGHGGTWWKAAGSSLIWDPHALPCGSPLQCQHLLVCVK